MHCAAGSLLNWSVRLEAHIVLSFNSYCSFSYFFLAAVYQIIETIFLQREGLPSLRLKSLYIFKSISHSAEKL